MVIGKLVKHSGRNEFDCGYDYGYNDGYSQGRYEVLNTIAELVKENKYPEYLEMDIFEYLKMEGIIDENN